MDNWVSAMDSLAAHGVIDFDAASYILDKPARYIGNPRLEQIPMQNPMYLPDGVKLKDIPNIDIYEHPENEPLVKNPKWKKILFGTILAIGAGALTLKGIISTGKFPKLNQFFYNKTNYLKTVYKNLKNKIFK